MTANLIRIIGDDGRAIEHRTWAVSRAALNGLVLEYRAYYARLGGRAVYGYAVFGGGRES